MQEGQMSAVDSPAAMRLQHAAEGARAKVC